MRPRLPALAALAAILIAASAHADEDDPSAAPAPDLAVLPSLRPLPPLPDLPSLDSAPEPTPEPTPEPAPEPTPTPTLLSIPASPSATLGQYDEYHRPIPAYSIDATPVAVASYDTCVAAGHCTRPSCTLPRRDARVTCVDVAQATAYCTFAGGRLPTEEEWEHAAREASSLGMLATDDAAEWTSSPYCYFCGKDDRVVRGGPARNPALRGWRPPGTHTPDLGFRCAR